MKAIICLLLMFLCSSPFADTMSKWTKLDQVIVHDWVGVLVLFSEQSAVEAEGCDHKNQAVLEPSHYLFNGAYSAVLSALHSQNESRYFVSGCRQFGSKTIPIIKRIDLK